MITVSCTILTLLALAVTGAVIGRSAYARIAVYGGSMLLCLGLAAAGRNALTDPVQLLFLPVGLPGIGTQLRLDPLTGFFLVIIGLGGAAASLFALGYSRGEAHPERVLPVYPVFLAAMTLVVAANDAFTFLFGWELMSLASWALVMAHHREPGNARAGFIYLLMATFSGAALLLAFGLLAGADGGYAFETMRAHHSDTTVAAVVLAMTLIGAGSKAGLVPLHVWLPLAHPAAPSHVSALMSGVMTKVAVYGFMRIVFDLLGAPAWWAGVVVLVIGGMTAVLGVLYALMERDLKRLLAYSTVENIGIIFIGLGLTIAFAANGLPNAAALALTAALFHMLNHALFKSLLFFGAGAILNATGERDMEHLGGLIHRMPKTAVAVLAGCIAISALPPLNGFVSEWLTFQAILLHADLPQWGLKIAIPADGALLALAAALAAACFVRAFGICFLGRPRTVRAAEAREVDTFSLAAMFGCTAICLLFGVLPGAVIDGLAPVAQAITGARMPVQLDRAWLSVAPVADARSSYDGLLVLLFIVVATWLTVRVVHRFGSRAVHRGPPWDCGFPDPSPATQYTAGSFSQPIRRVYGTVVFQARETVTMPPPGDLTPARIHPHLRDPVWDTFYVPLAGAVGWVADQVNVLQFLTIRRYLGFVFAALVVLLLLLALWQ